MITILSLLAYSKSVLLMYKNSPISFPTVQSVRVAKTGSISIRKEREKEQKR